MWLRTASRENIPNSCTYSGAGDLWMIVIRSKTLIPLLIHLENIRILTKVVICIVVCSAFFTKFHCIRLFVSLTISVFSCWDNQVSVKCRASAMEKWRICPRTTLFTTEQSYMSSAGQASIYISNWKIKYVYDLLFPSFFKEGNHKTADVSVSVCPSVRPSSDLRDG